MKNVQFRINDNFIVIMSNQQHGQPATLKLLRLEDWGSIPGSLN